jgi:tetratricopeptide (TPR) repeat protein
MDAFAQALERHKAGDLAAAEAGYRAALAGRPDHDDAWGNLGLVLARRDDPEAEAALRRAGALRPDKASHAYNLGNYLYGRGRLAEADAAFAAAWAIDEAQPGLAISYALTRLALGDFELGWALYDQRPERLRTAAWALGFPEWRGEPLEGRRLFVWVEQGFGDLILAARFLRRLPAQSITYACRPPLVRLMSHLPVTVVPYVPPMEVAPHDYWALPMSLPRWMPGPLWDGPYLQGDGARRGRFGLAWRGNASPDPGRSLPQHFADRLLSLPGAVSLDPEASGAQDFQDTADLIAGLDLVVSVDTSVAHLAGAMGKPVWLLLQERSVDWRWTQGWYPDVRVFRQPAQGDWASVLAEVEAALR